MNYGPEPEAGKAQTGGNDGNGNGGTGNDGNGSGDPFDLRVAEWALSAELMQMVQLQGEPLEELFVSFIKAALRKNADEDNIIKACLDHKSPYGGSIYKHVKAAGGENYVKQTIARIANALPTRTEREIIRLGFGGDTDKDWRKVEEILLQKKLPVYVRNGRLVQPLWRLHKNYDDDQKNYQYVLSVELARYSLIQLTDMIAHHAVQFQKWDKRIRDWRNIDPPVDIVTALLGAHHYKLPEIVGIITSPTMRPDGSLLTEPGYDEVTQLWYKPSDNVQLPPIPEQPTRQDAVQALAFINALLDGFPFDGETKEKSTSVARSAALAAILTTAARGALTKAVPLFLVTAPKPRTGKTYLINVIVLLATGHVPVSIAGAEKKEEFEKRVETAALTGRAILHLNNLPEGMVVESERLSELSTDGMVYIRKLGRHEEGLCDCRATTAFLNGNNVLVSSDLVPRTVHCRINAQRENPGTRKFTPPYPDQRVRANRGAYLAAVFTIIRAFRAAGSPKQQCNSVAGFEQWSRLVQQALIWLGMDDPLGAMEEMQTMDPQEEKLKQLMAALHECKFDDNKFTVAKCNDKINEPTGERGPFGQPIYKHTALRELMSSEGKINLRSFGQWLMQMRDKICDGWQIRVSGTKGPARIYHLVQVKAVATPEPATAAAPAQPVPAAASAQEEEAF